MIILDQELIMTTERSLIGYLLTCATAGAWRGSVEVTGGTLSHSAARSAGWRGSLIGVHPVGRRGAERLKRGLPCSK